jgi:phosphoglucomutase/phosphomannomutase
MDFLKVAEQGMAQVDAPEINRKEALKHLAKWLTHQDFAGYHPQIKWLIEQGDFGGLVDRFFQILPFGTGGRRGPVGIGPNRMNSWTLGASVQGHSDYLHQRFPGKKLAVAVGYDVRSFQDQRCKYSKNLPNPLIGLSSRKLAEIACQVYAANDIQAWILPEGSDRFPATPELSFIIRKMGLHGGLNISASHNPPDDNGGKFYDERGAQPVPPEDQLMADLVEKVKTIQTVDWIDGVKSNQITFLDNGPHKDYIRLLEKQSLASPPKKGELLVVFTPLHGVGAMTAMELLEARGFQVAPVAEQMQPDGQFPNVTKSPNPEVPESMDRAEAVAKSVGADLVLATDPDADRLGAMVPDDSGKFRFITGNQIAAMLTAFKLEALRKQGILPSSPIVVKTEVTTRMITRICQKERVQLVDDLLVGFKYIAEVLRSLETIGEYGEVRGRVEDFVIATEESHGVLVTQDIRDKDAAGAALLMAELALTLKREGSSAWNYLLKLQEKYGYFRNDGVNIQMEGVTGRARMARMLDSMRTSPPSEIAGRKVTRFIDLRDPDEKFGPIQGETDAAARNVLIFELGESTRVVLRPSGTEPKAKAYIEISCAPRPAGMTDTKWSEAQSKVDADATELGIAFVNLAKNLGS